MADDSRFEPLDTDDIPGVAGYAFRARIGTGGMGRVYLSFTPGGRAVAVKVVRPDYAADAEFRRRFKQEITAARSVEGFYTAPVVDADPDARVPWLATAYIPGPTLTEAVRRHGPLPEHTVFRLLAGVAEGLKAVHARSLVHRDLKPANVLLAADGPRVIDFGIAHAVDATTASLTGKRMGTPAFMAPEQVLNRDIGPATDVFALGGLASFAATGQTAFGEGLAVFHRITDQPADLENCPADVRRIVERCLEKSPDQRPDLDEVIAYAREQFTGKTLAYTDTWLPQTVAAELGRYDIATAPPPPKPKSELPTVQVPVVTPISTAPPTMTAQAVAAPPYGAQTHGAQPYGAQPYGAQPYGAQPYGPGQGQSQPPLPPYGPPPNPQPYGMPPQGQPPKNKNTAIGVAAAIAAALLVGGVALAVTKPWQDTTSNTASVVTSSSTSSQVVPTTSVVVVPTTSVVVVPTTSIYVPPSTSHQFAWADLDEQATDKTPQTAAAMLPDTFTDSDGRTFTLQGSGPLACDNQYANSSVRNILSSNHCASMVEGAYVNSEGSILVSVKIMAFADVSTATSVEGQLHASAHTGDIGWVCPQNGAGANVCNTTIPSSAMVEGWTNHYHRYVLSSSAIYTNFASSGNSAALKNSSEKGIDVSGPDNYWNSHQ